MRSLFALLACSLLIEAAQANTAVKLRAGEHPQYSRIVVPESAGWTISNSGRDVVILFADGTPRFDISDLVEKRKAHRAKTARLEQRGNRTALVITLDCNCRVETRAYADNGALIDIFDAPNATSVVLQTEVVAQPQLTQPAPAAAAPTANTTEAAAQTTAPSGATAPSLAQAENESAATAEELAEPTALAPAPETETAATVASNNSTSGTELETQHTETPTPSPTARNRDESNGPPEDLLAARDRMIALLAEARARGVVQLKDTPEGEKIARANADEVQDGENGGSDVEAAICLDPTLLADLPGESRDYESIMTLRQEYESTEEAEARISLAQDVALAYLRIGFFEEASAIAMSTYERADPELELAAALAEIGGAAQTNASGILAQYKHCGPSYEMLNAAVASRDGIEYTAGLSRRQFNALNGMMRSMRGPLAELFALNAIDNEQPENLRRFYQIAVRARSPETNDALALIENALADAPEGDPEAMEPIMEIAQIPGPMQTRALGELAALYERNAEIAYEGFLEDLAAEKTKRSSRRADARASFAGARALAISGRVGESVDLLVKAGTSFSAAKLPARQLARSIIMDALAGNDQLMQLLAIETFLRHSEFLSRDVNGDDSLNVAVARKLADFGLNRLTDDVIAAASNTNQNPEHLIVRAQALLNAGDASAAFDLARKQSRYQDAVLVAIKASERLGETEDVLKSVAKAIKEEKVTEEIADAAWRAGDWNLAAQAYAQLASENSDSSERYALAALMAGQKELPESAAKALKDNPEALATLEHMYAPPPTFTHGNLDMVTEYANGVSDEAARIRERLSNE